MNTQKKRKQKSRNIVVIYHQECLDGFGAAWSAWKKFGNRARYYPVRPHQLPEERITNADVFVCDSSLPVDVLKKLRARGCHITVLDHHAGSKEDIYAADEYVFDPDHSGAYITWRFFHQNQKMPRLIQYINDGDLWLYRFKETGAVHNMISLKGFDFAVWNRMARTLDDTKRRKNLISHGNIIEEYREYLIAQSVLRAQLVSFEGHTVYAINEGTESIRSEVAHRLYEKHGPFSIVWAVESDGVHISLRSKKGKFDVSKLAKKYGGGGHPFASGIYISLEKPLPWKPVRPKLK